MTGDESTRQVQQEYERLRAEQPHLSDEDLWRLAEEAAVSPHRLGGAIAAVVVAGLGAFAASQVVLNETVRDDVTRLFSISAIVLGVVGIGLAVGVWWRRTGETREATSIAVVAVAFGFVALTFGIVGLLRDPIENAGSCWTLRPVAVAEYDQLVEEEGVAEVTQLQEHVIDRADELKARAERKVAEGGLGMLELAWLSGEPERCDRLVDELSHWSQARDT